MPSIVPFPIHKCYLFFSFLNMTSHPHSTSKWNGRTFLMQGRCWLYICIWRYSEIKDYTFGQEPRGGPTTGVNRLCWCLWCWFCLWWFFRWLFMMVASYIGCILFYISFSSRTLQPDSLEREQTAWCGSGSKRRKGLTSPSPSAIIDHNLMVILNSYCNTHTRWS